MSGTTTDEAGVELGEFHPVHTSSGSNGSSKDASAPTAVSHADDDDAPIEFVTKPAEEPVKDPKLAQEEFMRSMVAFGDLFCFASPTDKFLIFIAIIFAAAAGAVMPGMSCSEASVTCGTG